MRYILLTTIMLCVFVSAWGQNKQINDAEYFLDVDPGPGNGTSIPAYDGNFNYLQEVVSGGNITGPIQAGLHVLYVRSKNRLNNWGTPFGVVVYIDTTIGPFTTEIDGADTICDGLQNAYLYTVPYASGHSYNWTVAGGVIVSGTGTDSVWVQWDGTAPYTLILEECNNGASLCDTDTLEPVVLPPSVSTINIGLCAGDSLFIDGAWQDTAGVFYDTLHTAGGCDSVTVTNLVVLPIITSILTDDICQGDTLEGYTTAGTYNDTFTAANGCDSIRTLELTVNGLPVSPTINQMGDTLLVAAQYTTYQWYLNDTLINGATDSSLVISANGSYTVQVTDSNGCNTADTIQVTSIGLHYPDIWLGVRWHPNPVAQDLFISVDNGKPFSWQVYNNLGQLISSGEVFATGEATIDLVSLQEGLYIIHVKQGYKLYMDKIMKISIP